jgi:glycerophosphoryl diester phosphodiesterase
MLFNNFGSRKTNMRNYLILLAFLLLCSSTTHAQVKPRIYLSSYVYDVKTGKLGFINSMDGSNRNSLTIGGPNAAAVSMKNNLLSVKPAARKAGKALHIEVNGQQFTILKNTFIDNKVIAHRGAWKHTGATENSIGSLNAAFQLGCKGSEFDVHMSADSVLFIHHDPVIAGLKIEESTAAQLRALKLDNGETLPTLEEYLTAGMKQQKTRLILEIKASVISKARGIALEKRVLKMVEDMQAQAWVDYISFDYDICKELIKDAPYARVAYLNGDKSPAELAAGHFFGLDYHLSVFKKNPTWIKEAKDLKLDVNVWTVNEEADMDYFLKEGADVITTNEPELLLNKTAI